MDLFRQIDALEKRIARAELAAAEAERALADERQGRALDADAAQRRLDQAAASLGAKVAEVARLERELAIAKAAIPETVTCSGCGCHALVIDLGWNTRQYHFAAGGLCGHWMKDGTPWVLDCEHPADVAETRYPHCQGCGEDGALCADGYCGARCCRDANCDIHGADVRRMPEDP